MSASCLLFGRLCLIIMLAAFLIMLAFMLAFARPKSVLNAYKTSKGDPEKGLEASETSCFE